MSYLREVGRLDEAAQRLARLVNDERFVSRHGKSNYQVGAGGTHGCWVGAPMGGDGHPGGFQGARQGGKGAVGGTGRC